MSVKRRTDVCRAGARAARIVRSPAGRSALGAVVALAALLASAPMPAAAQDGRVVGRVVDAATGEPVAGASVIVDGENRGTVADSAGRFVLLRVPPGPQVLVAQRIGYASARVRVTVPARGAIQQEIELATTALELPDLTVTADPGGRAEGELGTASVIDREAIAHQTATSLAGVLELLPGMELQPPGLGSVQQVALRQVATGSAASLTLGGPGAADLASFGTLIIRDGVPMSNNANLQTTGPRGELPVPSSARGGIDLRRIPASTIERVEVIRGIPSARYGDLTQGAIVVNTRAGEFEPTLGAKADVRTVEGSALAGSRWAEGHTVSGGIDVARTRLSPGMRDDQSYRISGQLAHRARWGAAAGDAPNAAGLTLDSRVDLYQVYEESPENPEVLPGRSSSNRDAGVRFSERARLALSERARLELTASLDHGRQRSTVRRRLVRGALPFTDRTEEGRATGRYIGGEYQSELRLDGDVWYAYGRLEGRREADWLGLDHRARAGIEARREWNAGAGYQFDIEFPPQITFNGVQGFDRPRRFDAIPPLATSALYLDDRVRSTLPGDVSLEVQAGLRLGLLHDRGGWTAGVRDVVAQPRLNAQLAPWPWLRLRGGWARLAKTPQLGQLNPAPQYFDVVNVNWYTVDPAERLAVLTTFVRDPTNPDLGFARAAKREAGIELELPGSPDASLSLVAFQDRTDGGVGFRSEPQSLLRHRYALSDSVIGDGEPTTFVEPPTGADTVPVLLDVPANNLSLDNRGIELTARLPEFRPLRTRLEVTAAWVETELAKSGFDFGRGFSDFQLNEEIPRAPFWEDIVRTGTRGLATYRLVHHDPSVGLVITGVIQHTFEETQRDIGSTDSLAYAGYVTRSGEIVMVPPAERDAPEYADLRSRPRSGAFIARTETPPDWLMSLQVSKTLPADGRLSFYAFNVFDRLGRFATAEYGSRQYPPMRFGLELTWPLGGLRALW